MYSGRETPSSTYMITEYIRIYVYIDALTRLKWIAKQVAMEMKAHENPLFQYYIHVIGGIMLIIYTCLHTAFTLITSIFG